MKKRVSAIVLMMGVLLAFGSSPIYAQTDAVSSNLEVYRITTDANGNETAEQTTAISPGDTVEYRLTYTNNMNESISNLQPVLPVPEGLRLLADTASPELAAASLDASGENFESLPIQREVTLDSGETARQEVPGSEYRSLRWMVSSLDAQESTTLVVRMRVIDASGI